LNGLPFEVSMKEMMPLENLLTLPRWCSGTVWLRKGFTFISVTSVEESARKVLISDKGVYLDYILLDRVPD
jgi:hypothetical protein